MKPIPILHRNLAVFFILLSLFCLIFINEIKAASCDENENKKSPKCSEEQSLEQPPISNADSNLPEQSGEMLEFANQLHITNTEDVMSVTSNIDLSKTDAKIGGQQVIKLTQDQSLFDGCSHGFWKNHTNVWVGYSTAQTLENVFDMPDSLGMDNATLLDALNFTGGGGEVGFARNLMRQAVGLLLNASHPSISAPLNVSQIITQTNYALAYGVDETQALTVLFDQYNNLGCPIDGRGGDGGGGGGGTTTPPGGGGNGTTTPPGSGGNEGGDNVGGGSGSFMPGGASQVAGAANYLSGAGGSIGGGQFANDTGGLLNPIMLPDAGIGPDANLTVLGAFLVYLGF